MRMTADDLAKIVKRPGYRAVEVGQQVVVAPKRAARRPSELELLFSGQIKLAGLPVPEREHRPIPGRKWRLDFAWPGTFTGVEVQGMVHRIKGRFKADIEKRATLLLSGWVVLEVDGDSIRNGRALQWLTSLLG